MYVYIVLRGFNVIKGVFSTKEKAEEYVETLPDNFECWIEDWKVK